MYTAVHVVLNLVRAGVCVHTPVCIPLSYYQTAVWNLYPDIVSKKALSNAFRPLLGLCTKDLLVLSTSKNIPTGTIFRGT